MIVAVAGSLVAPWPGGRVAQCKISSRSRCPRRRPRRSSGAVTIIALTWRWAFARALIALRGDPQRAERVDWSTTVLGCAGGSLGLGGAGSGLGVDWVGLALPPAGLAVGAVDLHQLHARSL